MIHKKHKIQELIQEYTSVSTKYHDLSAKMQIIHKENYELAEKMLPKIKKAIIEEIFNKGKCFECEWMYIDNGGKAAGDFYQLNNLVKVRPSKKKEEFPGTIFQKQQLNYRWVEPRILDRYFNYYEPKFDVLLKELKIKI